MIHGIFGLQEIEPCQNRENLVDHRRPAWIIVTMALGEPATSIDLVPDVAGEDDLDDHDDYDEEEEEEDDHGDDQRMSCSKKIQTHVWYLIL